MCFSDADGRGPSASERSARRLCRLVSTRPVGRLSAFQLVVTGERVL
jgi:hypothetical protein